MIDKLERLGVRMLERIVPGATADAGYCGCEIGSVYCCGGGWLCMCADSGGGHCYSKYLMFTDCKQ